MRNELPREHSSLPDGSINFGTGVIGPTPQDIEYESKPPDGLVTVSHKSRLGEILNRLGIKNKLIPVGAAIGAVSMFLTACETGAVSTSRGTETPTPVVRATQTPSESAAPPPKWYLIQGPHSDGLSNGNRYAIDIGLQNPNQCPGPPVYNNPFPSPAAGEVIHAGGESLSDYYRSIVEIQTKSGEILGIMHLANIKVGVGVVIKTGEALGDPSCEKPPGGDTNSSHVHVYLRDIEENPVPIKGVIFTDGTVGELPENYKGYLDKDGVQKLSNSTHFDSGPNKNVLENYLQLVSTGNGSFRMELRFADGKPIYNQEATIFSVVKDIDGNSKPDREIRKISSGELGILQTTLPPGEYMLLFDEHDEIKGTRFAENEERVGISDIEVRQDQITTRQTTLGRIIVNMKDDPQRPTKGSFTKRDTAQAEVCIDGLNNGEVYQIECMQLSDLDQDGIVGLSRAVFNLMPSDSYLVWYAWDDGFNGFEDYTARIDNTQGQTRVASGQTTEFDCFVYAPETDADYQPADCTVRTVK